MTRAALATLRRKFPGARIGDVEIERRGKGFRVFEAELRQNGIQQDVQVTDAGMLVCIKTHIRARQLPAPVTQALRKMAGGKVRVRESERVLSYAKPGETGIARLAKPATHYEIAFRKGWTGKREVCLSPTGKVLGAPDANEHENDGEEDDDD